MIGIPTTFVIDAIHADTAALATIRRDIHAHSELGFCEQRTSDIVATTLTQWGHSRASWSREDRCRRCDRRRPK